MAKPPLIKYCSHDRYAALALADDAKNALTELGMKQSAFCRLIGVDARAFYAMLDFGLTPAQPQFFEICELLGLEPEKYDFTGANEKKIKRWRATRYKASC